MTPDQFEDFWALTYPETLPIQHLLRYNYSDKWFRIHSLPHSKRYADTEEEWRNLMSRQNIAITDVLGNNSKVLLVTGDYNYNEPNAIHITEQEPDFLPFSFQRIGSIDLHKLSPDQYLKGEVHRPAFTEIVWKPHVHDNLLKSIADDKVRAFFVLLNHKAIVAPYDGGIDFILKDIETRDQYKEKYRDWLSERKDGL